MPLKIMIDKKTYKKYKRLLDMLKKEDDKLKELRKINHKNQENYILRKLEDREDKDG